MTLEQFISKHLGTKVDFDGAYGGQCVDLFRQYVDDCLSGNQPKPVGGAADFWTNYDTDQNLNKYFDRIENTPEGVPYKGDVVLWNKKSGGGYGHVAIFIEGNSSKFTSLDQNWPTLSLVTKTGHYYTNVLGWLHPKETMAETVQVDKSTFETLVTKSTRYDALVAEGISQPADVQKIKDISNEYKTQMEKYQQESKAVRDELSNYKQSVADKLGSTQDLPRILGAIDEIVGTIDQLTTKVRITDEELRQYEITVMDLKSEISRLQMLLKGNDSLSQATMYDMLLELFNRIVRLLKGV